MKTLRKNSVKYINAVDEEFVTNFAKKIFLEHYNSKDVKVDKTNESWRVICDSKHRIVYLEDFSVRSLSSSAKTLFYKRWQIALYEKFGDKYLKDLKKHLTDEANKEHYMRRNRIDKFVASLKEELVK